MDKLLGEMEEQQKTTINKMNSMALLIDFKEKEKVKCHIFTTFSESLYLNVLF